jgi:hypothetical protein
LPGTTNKGQTLGFHPGSRDSVLDEHHHKCKSQELPTPHAKATAARYQTPGTHEEHVPPIFTASNMALRHFKPPIIATTTLSTSFNTLDIKKIHVPWHRQESKASRSTLEKGMHHRSILI